MISTATLSALHGSRCTLRQHVGAALRACERQACLVGVEL
jgi:hypothetical protein